MGLFSCRHGTVGVRFCIWTGILLVSWSQVTPWANFLGLLVLQELKKCCVTLLPQEGCVSLQICCPCVRYPPCSVADVLAPAHMVCSQQ